MPQGDDFVTTPAPAPVDDTPPAAAAPVGADPAASAPADPTPAPPAPPDETPEQRQAKSDRAFAALRRANDAKDAKLAAQEARLAALEARVSPAPGPPPAPAASDAAPTPEAFPDHASYVQAVAVWAVEQGERSRAARAEQTALTTAWETQEATAKAQHPDYDEVLAADTTRYHPAVLQALQTSELGSEVAYHLATHPEDATRIAALAPSAAVRALGRLEARLESAAAPAEPAPDPTPPPTPKPRPLAPVGGAGTGGSTVSPDQMTHEQYCAWYSKTFGSR